MPVLGHAVAGWALATQLRPREESALGRDPGRAFWTPSLIALAFLPDVASQAAILAGVPDPTPITHSLVLSGGAAVLAAAAFGRWAGMGLGRALLLGLLLVPGHVLLDLLQSPWRPALWPLSSEPSGLPPLLPETARGEALLSALVAAAFAWWRHGRGSTTGAAATPARYVAIGLTAVILSLAGATHYLRGLREARYGEALDRLAAGDGVGALRLADEADRWPQATPPGRIDYVRAEAKVVLQDAEGAKRYLVRSLRQDPRYFWARADLCVLYATSPRPAEERRQETLPCLRELRTRFADHPDLGRMASRAELALSRSPPPAGPTSELPEGPESSARPPAP